MCAIKNEVKSAYAGIMKEKRNSTKRQNKPMMYLKQKEKQVFRTNAKNGESRHEYIYYSCPWGKRGSY